MKKLMFFVSMVAAIFAFSSCEKEAEINQIIYDGTSYNVTPHLGYSANSSRYFLDVMYDSTVNVRCDLFSVNLGKTYDLSKQAANDDFSLMFQFPETYINMENHPDYFAGCVNDQTYENESPFKSGKMSFAKDGDNFTFTITGAELKNGKKLSVSLEITPAEFEEFNW